jgi:hypothetical protein
VFTVPASLAGLPAVAVPIYGNDDDDDDNDDNDNDDDDGDNDNNDNGVEGVGAFSFSSPASVQLLAAYSRDESLTVAAKVLFPDVAGADNV